MRLYRGSLVALLVLLIPEAASGQRPGGTGGGGGFGGMGGRGPRPGGMDGAGPAAMPSSKDILQQSPIRLLLDKKKDLALTDSQKVKLVNRQSELDQALAPALARLDSAGKEGRGDRDVREASDEDRMRMMERMTALRALMENVRAKEDSASALAVADLTEQQQPKAKELLEKRREEIKKKESRPERRMGRPGGSGQPGMRPPELLD